MRMRIRELRLRKDMTQQDVADHLGVSHVAVYKWESGEIVPSARRLPQIAKLFDVSISELYEKEG